MNKPYEDMFIIDDKIVSSELFSRQFICHLSKCKGACCHEGDYGAPIADDEMVLMDEVMTLVVEKLPEQNRKVLFEHGACQYDEEYGGSVTSLMPDGACAFMIYDDQGIARCSIEAAYYEGKTTFKKPISCHLYPIRISQLSNTGQIALNYDEWDICKSACNLGKEHNMPVFRFVKEALIRAFGEEFYNQMEQIDQDFFSSNEKKQE